jgi:hypothetical protein
MIQQDFYSGEPVNLGSPNFSPESEAAKMASFGMSKYDYGSGTRSFTPNNQQPFMNQPIGIGAPYFQQTQYSPYGNPLPMYRPFPGQQQFQFQMPQQPTTYHVPGFNLGGGEFLPETGYEDRINDLQFEYWQARQEVDVKTEMDMQQSVYGNGMMNGFNYYGMPYYNPYKYNSLDNEFGLKLNKIKDQAKENRKNLNINLLKLANNILGNNVSDEEIEQRCSGFDVQVSQAVYGNPQEQYLQTRIANMVPFDNSSYYRNARNNHLKEVQEILPPDANMEETFKNLGILAAKYEMEEEMHRRKDLSGSYGSENNAYKYYVKRKARERYAAEHGMVINENGTMQPNNTQFATTFGNQVLNGLPTLSQNATIADDGTLNVSLSLPVNVGSHRGEVYTVSNQNEAEYEKKRQQFGKFLDSIKSDIYLDDLKQKKFENSSFI